MRAIARSTLGSLLLLAACGGPRVAQPPPVVSEFGFYDGSNPHEVGPRAPRVHWTLNLAPAFEGRSVPVETSGAALDTTLGLTYVGSSRGTFWALGPDGGEVYRFDAGDAVDGAPALDPAGDELYVVNARGVLHALKASDGTARFEVDLGGSVSADMLLAEDALYVVTDTDIVMAIAREDGSILWRYRRDPVAGLGLVGHAGLLLAERRIITGFSDGSVVALDATDGSVAWELDTTLDVDNPEDMGVFVDADATPIRAGDTLFVASAAAGLYALDIKTGSLQQRFAELTGITGMAADAHSLVVTSSDFGVLCMDLAGFAHRWKRDTGQGAPGQPFIVDGAVFIAESRGALLSLALADGREVGRLESGHGFTASPTLRSGRGAIVSNAGLLFSFTY